MYNVPFEYMSMFISIIHYHFFFDGFAALNTFDIDEDAFVEARFLVALPSSTLRTRAAKFNEQQVSSELKVTGLTHTNMRVLLSCDKESYNRRMSQGLNLNVEYNLK